MTRLRVVGLSMGLAVALATPPFAAQQPPNETALEKQQIKAALKLTTEAAGRYEIVLDGVDDAPAKLRAEPVLRWSNPAVGEVHGNVFLWTVLDRPVAVGSLFKWFSPHKHTSHEFQSLAEVPVTASYDDRPVWITKDPGVTFLPLADVAANDVAAPAVASARRLTQMRDLAKRFTGHMTTREGDERQLRLLPQPIYRYEDSDDGVVAGGLFAFVESTDPEILLLLEARGEKSPRWHFAGARMQNVALKLAFDNHEVWSVEQLEWSMAFDHTQPYTLFDTPGK